MCAPPQLSEAKIKTEISQVRHEQGMAENRLLAAQSKQASIQQDQVAQLQEVHSPSPATHAALPPVPSFPSLGQSTAAD